MPRMHLHDTCGLVGMVHAFGTVGHACGTKCEKCEKEGKAYVRIMLKEFKSVSTFSNRTEHEDMVISQDDHSLYLLR